MGRESLAMVAAGCLQDYPNTQGEPKGLSLQRTASLEVMARRIASVAEEIGNGAEAGLHSFWKAG